MEEQRQLVMLKISDILPNRFQPRIKFEDNSLNQLAASIDKYGVLEPVIVRPIGNRYEIIAGERRYKASRLVGKSTIPAIVISLSDKESEELALLENVQRKSLNPIEEAVSYKRILDSGNITREELSNKIGKPQSEILGKIRLLSLADEVQNYLLNNKISERHARSLLNIDNLNDQSDMLHRIVDERLTVKATDREIRKLLEEKSNDNSSDSEIIEDLFADEKGDSQMDIDKIMREAKDIDTQEEAQEKPVGPDLMTSGNDPQSELIKREDELPIPIRNTEPSKFFSSVSQTMSSVSESENPISGQTILSSGSKESENNNVTFDSMFSSSVLNNNSQRTDSVEKEGISGIVAEAMKKYNSLNDNTTAEAPAPVASEVTPAPAPVASEIAPAPAPVAPEIAPAPAPVAPEVTPAPTSVVPEVTPAPAPVAPEIAPAPASVVPEVTPDPAPVVPEVTPASAPVTPEVTPDPAPVTPEVTPAPAPVAPEVTLAPAPVTPEVTPAPAPVTPEVTPAPAPVAPEPSSVIVPSNLYLSKSSIPDDSIIEDDAIKQTEVSGQEVNNNKISESHTIPKFARVIKMLRDCADEIENSGYLINLDEIDLDKQYKVIFTIDKE